MFVLFRWLDAWMEACCSYPDFYISHDSPIIHISTHPTTTFLFIWPPHLCQPPHFYPHEPYIFAYLTTTFLSTWPPHLCLSYHHISIYMNPTSAYLTTTFLFTWTPSVPIRHPYFYPPTLRFIGLPPHLPTWPPRLGSPSLHIFPPDHV